MCKSSMTEALGLILSARGLPPTSSLPSNHFSHLWQSKKQSNDRKRLKERHKRCQSIHPPVERDLLQVLYRQPSPRKLNPMIRHHHPTLPNPEPQTSLRIPRILILRALQLSL